ncbi:MAG: exodeoxyribonuclease V subunit alpha [Desulfobacterales bacterium]|jgi:exodeoxyribonuclease V alpha subunit|nr:exodeoxyribonuclease V subunit alpha [Desulfobacterales bacterium]
MVDWRDTGLFSAADLHFARLIARLAAAADEGVALAAALVSRAAAAGDVCLDLNRLAGGNLSENASPLTLPPAEAWLSALAHCPAVGRPGERRPLVLDHRKRLYLHRYWEYEQRLACALRARVRSAPPEIDPAQIRAAIRRHFPEPPPAEGIDWQQVAVAVGLSKRFAVISGGPGTGKTFTVSRLIAVCEELAPERPPRVILAAPTGKAAARLVESLRRAGQGAPQGEVFTLHRLLQPVAGTPLFRHHAANPLAVDLLVVDEASMVDLALMAKLVDALPPEARLILVGDKDQLASVEAGSVLGDICGRGRTPVFSPAMAGRVRELTGQAVPTGEGAGELADCIVELQTGRRFAAGSAIAELSRAVNRGDSQRAIEILARPEAETVAWLEAPAAAGLEPIVSRGYGHHAARGRPAELLEGLERFRILCAHRAGAFGAEGVNRLTERLLSLREKIRFDPRRASPWYAGRPVLITRNDYGLGLFNGDTGITLPDPDGAPQELFVFFPAAGVGVRRFLPYRLPEHETVFAMTVHKSQGSEFDEVLLVLPDRDSPVLTRELIYTALTRARKRLTVSADRALLSAAIRRRIERTSGLQEALWGEE